jgi:hypothetical protein
MRLVFVHGIKHEARSSDWVKKEWMGALKASLSDGDYALVTNCEIVAPFYGKVLGDETDSESGAAAVAMSVGGGVDEKEYFSDAMEDAVVALGISEDAIAAADGSGDPIVQGAPHDRRIIAIAKAIETLSPLHGQYLIRVLKQAYVYLKKPRARGLVNDIVRPAIADKPCIVVGHSLGAVVTFNLLRETQQTAPFYMTMGGPLAIRSVKAALDRPFKRPEKVGRWLNGLDPDDFVAFGRPLTAETFGPGVDNIRDVENGDEDPHDFRKYLSDSRLNGALVAAIRAEQP